MKRRCPNHWTKGTKKAFFIYRSVGSENRSGAEPSTVTVERDCAKSSLPTSDDSQAVPFLLTVLLGQPNPNGKKGVSQTAVHFVRLLSRPIRHFFLEKGRELLTEGGSRNEGGGKLPRFKRKKRRGTTAQWCFYESTELCVTVATRPPREVLVTAPQVVSEMLLRGEAEAAKEEKLTLFQKKE
ncbi:hypothetical protein L1987_88691 [Smallanthus sonchifolius]|nr:hypothetical protein L1987_88691 [Smallanthus sonchifolius]